METEPSAARAVEIGEYRLHLDVDFERGTWSGRVEFDPVGPGGPIDLDADELEIRTVSAGGRPIDFRHDPAAGRLSFPVGGTVGGPVTVTFAGAVRAGQLIGLYRCRQGDGHLLTTQCEPVGARRIFPCLDRPDRKARFHLTVRTGAGLEVISNTPAASARPVDDGRTEHDFLPTPPMATYLFYLGIGRFDRAEAPPGRVAVRVLTPPGRGASGAYAAEAARRILDGFEEYFGIPYPLPKLDLLAVADHAFGAMENWGAISFRDSRILIDPDSETFARRDVFETTAHEIAHQWFGNLVTMRSWDDIWLNESFASLMETRLSQRLIPELDPLSDSFLRVAGTLAAFQMDALGSTHPVRAHVERPEEISQIFDEISYGKGCAVLGMLEAYLGPERFRRGVSAYLDRFRYANAQTDDLWAALGAAGGVDLGPIATPWIDRPGHPIVTATLDGGLLRLDQRRYSTLPRSDPDEPWPIPLVVEVDGTPHRMLFASRRIETPIPAGATVHANPGALGFFRVRYEGPLFERLLATLAARPVTDRFALASDYGSFLFSGHASWTEYLRLLRALGPSDDLLVVDTVVATLQSLARLLDDVPSVQDTARRYVAERWASVGVRRRDGEPIGAGVLRERLASARVRLDEGFARDLAELYGEWPRLDPDLRPAVAVARARTAGAAGWSELHRGLRAAATEGDAIVFDRALAWSGDPERVVATLDLILAGEIPRGHATAVLVQAATNPAGREVVWPWLARHLDEIAERFRGSGQLSMLVERLVPLAGLDRPSEVRGFFETHSYPEGTRGLRKGLERLEIGERVRGRRGDFSGASLAP